MKGRIVAGMSILATLLAAVSLSRLPSVFAQGSTAATTQEKEKWTAPRTPWGHPDLQGMYTSNGVASVPMERPKQNPTAEDLARRKRAEELRIQAGDRSADTNVVWNYDKEPALRRPKPTSLVVDPPDGRVPLTSEAQERTDRWEPAHFGIDVESWNDFDLWDRCITKGFPTVMIPMGHNNAYQIFQTPEYVAILYEIIHDVRIIPLDGRAHLDPAVRQYFGDSRGRWEGNTLVVDVTNFRDETFGMLQPAGSFRGGGRDLHVVERFTRVDADTIDYSATLEDPKAFTKPWTLALPSVKDDSYQMFEYACHEGNYGMLNIISAVGTARQKKGSGTRPSTSQR